MENEEKTEALVFVRFTVDIFLKTSIFQWRYPLALSVSSLPAFGWDERWTGATVVERLIRRSTWAFVPGKTTGEGDDEEPGEQESGADRTPRTPIGGGHDRFGDGHGHESQRDGEGCGVAGVGSVRRGVLTEFLGGSLEFLTKFLGGFQSEVLPGPGASPRASQRRYCLLGSWHWPRSGHPS